MYNPFMRPQHCARFATRRAFATGEVFHVVETGTAIAPLTVIDDQTLFDLGDGRPKGGGTDGKKNRAQVLDRLPRLGQGISAEQRNAFVWFKDNWDRHMLEEHGDQWPAKFASWAQRLVGAHAAGDRAAFSVFMHNQSTRCVGDEVALVVP